MLYIATALYLEASPFIKEFDLKKNLTHTKFEVFESKEITLIITGVSELQAAIALTYLFALRNPTPSDLLLNFGFCGSLTKEYALSELILCNKLISQGNTRTCYPDLPPIHPFKEASILSSKTVLTRDDSESLTLLPQSELVDMEAYGIYQSAIHFLSQHQMLFIKMISDYPKEESFTKDVKSRSQNLIEEGITPLLTWCKEVLLPSSQSKAQTGIYSQDFLEFIQEEQQLMEQLEEKLFLTSSMSASIRQHLLYAYCLNRPIKILLQDFLNRPDISNCKSKVEGKQYVYELKQLLKN